MTLPNTKKKKIHFSGIFMTLSNTKKNSLFRNLLLKILLKRKLVSSKQTGRKFIIFLID
jgi:hypothetical protein